MGRSFPVLLLAALALPIAGLGFGLPLAVTIRAVGVV